MNSYFILNNLLILKINLVFRLLINLSYINKDKFKFWIIMKKSKIIEIFLPSKTITESYDLKNK